MNRFVLITISLILFFGCQQKQSSNSSPTMGRVTIACDQQIKNILKQQEEIFEKSYKYADVNLIYENESSIFKLLGSDSVKTIVSCRSLNESEKKYFNSKQIRPREFPIAIGALALLVSKNQKDSTIKFEVFKDLCGGISNKTTKFMTIVVEDVNSGIARHLLNKLQIEKFGSNVYTIPNKTEIFSYLQNNHTAIAIVDWSEFSDSDDSQQKKRLENLRILGISRPIDSTQAGYLIPNQYELQDNRYPLIRTLYIISCSGKADLGLGFASFVAGDIGQKIILKAGLLPTIQSERWVELKAGDYKVVE